MYDKRSAPITELSSTPKKEPTAIESGSHETLVHIFERVAAAKPDHVAVLYRAERLSYGELNARANRVARNLRRRMVGTDSSNSFVAIYLDRSPEMLIAMLGILKAGCAYLPIDATYPVSRVMEMLEDAEPAILVTTSNLAAGMSDTLVRLPLLIVKMDEFGQDDELQDEKNLSVETTANDVAYLMYTSGSTGKPKGVMVTHRNVVRLLEQTQPWFQFGPDDVWTLFHSIAFDFSVWEIWGCLLTGGRLVMVSFETSRSPRDFRKLLVTEQVTVLNQTPSAFLMLLALEDDSAPKLEHLRFVIFGGEALQYRALMPWFRRYGETSPQLVNMYGITETTVHVTYRIVTAADATSTQDSLIGVPIPDLQLYLLDESGRPVPEGEIGELYVGGAGVSRGYLNRPQLNQERFVVDPSSLQDGSKLYRTGDLARIRADGEMVYLGRNDRQVKINGFRIELGEIEAAIAECPGVQQSCVVAHAADDGTQRLAAYFVPTSANPAADVLSRFLAEHLPRHMRPSFYVELQTLPLTPNGKIDRDALPKPTAGRVGDAGTGQHPQDTTEFEQRVIRIWSEALGATTTGLDDNFFDIGGTSLLLIRTHAHLESELSREIPITWMFECPTVRSLAARLSDNVVASTSTNRFQEQAQRQRNAFARLAAGKRVLQ